MTDYERTVCVILIALAAGCSGVYDGMTDDNAAANLALECSPGPGCSIFMETLGTCDSLAECEAKVKEMCAPYGGLKPQTTSLTHMLDGSIFCAGSCADGVREAHVTCNP